MNSDFRLWLADWLKQTQYNMEIRLLPSKRQVWGRDPEEIARTVDTGVSEKQHVYFGVLSREGQAGTKEAIKEAHCLWTDIDFKDLAGGKYVLDAQGKSKENPNWSETEAHLEADGIVATFDHAPSLRIMSGGGYHLYWYLEQTTTDIRRVEAVLKGLAKRLKADPSVAESARVLRVPDTMNWKYTPPRRVEIEDFTAETYSLDDFKEWELPQEEPKIIDLGIESEERFDVRRYLKAYKVPVVKIKPQGTATMFCLKDCLFKEDHSEKGQENEAAIVQGEFGKLSYQCFHAHCAERKWAEAREKISGKDPLTAFLLRELRPLVEKYVKELTGETSIGALHAWYDVKSLAERQETMAILSEMAGKRDIAWVGRKHGVFRPVDNNPRIMRIGGPKKDPLKITLPLELHTLVKLYPKNVILVAGEKDAGKSAFSFNVAYMNRDVMPVRYINSEMGEEELNDRLELFGYPTGQWEKITWIEQSSKFEDVIDPDGFNIIDFLEIGADAYAVVEDIKRVFDRLHKGLLLIVMQKRSYKDFAVGGEGTLEKARLAINLTKGGVCRITVAKNWTGKIRNPRGYECDYKIFSGGRMEMTPKGWYDPDIEEAIAPKSKKKLNIVTKKGTDGISTFDDAFVHEE
jgi:hypothetical protein